MADNEKQGQAAAAKAEQKVEARTQTQRQGRQDADSVRDQVDESGRTADASVAPQATPVVADVTGGERFSRKVTDNVDPRTGEQFNASAASGRLKGRHGEELLNATGPVVPGVDPDRIPAEALPGLSPDAGGDSLLAAAQAKAPSLTREFVDAMEMTEEQLAQIARGEISPPPTPGPVHTNDLYMTPGGWQVTPPGVPPEAVGGNAIAR